MSHGRGRQRLRRTLVIGEVALALPLLVASGLAAIGTDRFLRGSQGYDPRQVLTMRAVLPDAKYTDVELRRQFVAQVLERLSRLPGVEQAAVANAIPSGGSTASRPIEIEGRPNPDPANPPMVDYRAVTPAFFDTLRIPVLRGRQLSAGDVADGQPVIVVSESLAARYFPGEDPIGRRLRFGSGPWQTIVGVSGDVIQDWFNRRNYPTVYRPYVQAPTVNLAFAVRASGDLAALGREAAAVVRSVDAAQPVFMVLSMERLLNERTLGLQYISVIMGVFGALALLLAVVGVYSLMAYMVTQRTHEIGVRMALGASRASVLRLTVGQAARLTSWGVAIGLVLSIALGRFVEAGLVGVASNNIRVSLAFAAVLIAAALAAGYLPARRASSIDPVVALRSE